ncbi:MAG: hypothetical protein ACTS7I_01310, partial [Candidatus Hodgkinia cicadicola]
HLSNTLNSFRRQDSSSCVLASGTWQPPTSVECNSVRRSFAKPLLSVVPSSQIGCSYYISSEASFVLIDLILRLVFVNSLLNFSFNRRRLHKRRFNLLKG